MSKPNFTTSHTRNAREAPGRQTCDVCGQPSLGGRHAKCRRKSGKPEIGPVDARPSSSAGQSKPAGGGESADLLDKRRAAAGLPPMDEELAQARAQRDSGMVKEATINWGRLGLGWSGGSFGEGGRSAFERTMDVLAGQAREEKGNLPSEPDEDTPADEADVEEMTHFCGYMIPPLYRGPGLPQVIMDKNGETAYRRPAKSAFGSRGGNQDVWWSVKDDTAPKGYRCLVRFEGHEMMLAGGLREALDDPGSPAGRRRQELIGPLVTEAAGAGYDRERIAAAVEMLGNGGLQRAQLVYKTTTSTCECPAKRTVSPGGPDGKNLCKHQIAMIFAERLQWDPGVVYDVAAALGRL